MDGSSMPSDAAAVDIIGRRLVQQRLARNLTQKQLAHDAGISKRTLVRLEHGESTQLTNLIRVLRALDLLRNLDALIPAPPASPLQQLRAQSKTRKRARQSRGAKPSSKTWTWGDDAAKKARP